MPPRLRGKWALGITPRNFTWIMKDKLAVCERPGGYGDNHRRVRRQEEIIWLRENGFGCLISIIPAPRHAAIAGMFLVDDGRGGGGGVRSCCT